MKLQLPPMAMRHLLRYRTLYFFMPPVILLAGYVLLAWNGPRGWRLYDTVFTLVFAAYHVILYAMLHFLFGKIARERDSYRKLSKEMKYLAHHDALSGLPNRRLFEDRLQEALIRGGQTGQRVAVLFVDLDGFKTINDTMGHAFGDLLLQSAAQRLQACLREGDTLYRQGGDEFTILLERLGLPEDAAVVARRIQEAMQRPFQLNGQDVYVTTSVGISLYPDDASTVEQIMKHADQAMYRAKEQGKNSYCFY